LFGQGFFVVEVCCEGFLLLGEGFFVKGFFVKVSFVKVSFVKVFL